MKFKTMAAVGALLVGTPAFAQSTGGFQVGVTGGTLGIGPEIGYRAGSFGVRGNATFLGIDREIDSDGVEYDGKLKLKSYGAMVDLYPTGGGFRISGGARINRNRIALVATPTESVEIGDVTYTPLQIGNLTGRVEAKKLAPTLTVGYGGSASPGLKFGIDAGAMFQGRPRVRDLRTTGTLSTNAAFITQLENERDEIENDIDKFKIYPIFQLSLSYLFGASAPAYVEPVVMAPPPPPPAPVATQTCPDGSVIMATDICPPPPPPPPPPPAASPGERG